MYYIYLIQSKIDKSLYIGFAVNLEERLKKHNQGLVQSTKNKIPWEPIYHEAYKDKKDALQREKQLKRHAQAMTALKGRLKLSLIFSG